MADEENNQEEVQTETPAEETATKEVQAEEAKTEEAPAVEEVKEEEKKEVDMSKLSEEAIKVVEMVEKMAVLELADLVKVLEDKFGVSAAAPVAVAAAPSAADADGAEEKSEYNINITAPGSNKIGLIKAIRAATDLGLKEAKDVAESLPKVIREGVKKKEAEEIKKAIEESGATVELQ